MKPFAGHLLSWYISAAYGKWLVGKRWNFEAQVTDQSVQNIVVIIHGYYTRLVLHTTVFGSPTSGLV